jgi:hypothetical protein
MDGILGYFDTKLTSEAIEGVNGIIPLAKRMAPGFRSFVYFRTAAYRRAGLYSPDLQARNRNIRQFADFRGPRQSLKDQRFPVSGYRSQSRTPGRPVA